MTEINLGTPDMTSEDLRQILNSLVVQKRAKKKELAEVLGIGYSTLNSWMGKAGKFSTLPPAKVIPDIVAKLWHKYSNQVTPVYATDSEITYLQKLQSDLERIIDNKAQAEEAYQNVLIRGNAIKQTIEELKQGEEEVKELISRIKRWEGKND